MPLGQLRDIFGTTSRQIWNNFATTLDQFWENVITTLGQIWLNFGTIWWLSSDCWRSVPLPCGQHMAIFTWLLLVLLIANSFRKGLSWARDVWDIVGVKMRSEWWCEAWRWEKAVQIFRPAGMMGVCALHILSISLCSFLPSIIVETIELCKYLTLHKFTIT